MIRSKDNFLQVSDGAWIYFEDYGKDKGAFPIFISNSDTARSPPNEMLRFFTSNMFSILFRLLCFFSLCKQTLR